MGGLCITVGAISAGVAAGTFALRHRLPTFALLVLTHAAASGMIIAASSSDALCDQTTWLLGKVRLSSNMTGLQTRLQQRLYFQAPHLCCSVRGRSLACRILRQATSILACACLRGRSTSC
jgi:hypothetical protein